MAAIDDTREVLAALSAAHEDLERLVREGGESQVAELRTKITEQVRKVAGLRTKLEERSKEIAALSAEVAERDASIARIEEELNRLPPIFTEDQKRELMALLGRR